MTFKLQIIYPDGSALPFVAGRENPFEIDLKAALKAAILKRGVGFLKTEAQVGIAIDDGFDEALMTLKEKAPI